MITDRYCRKCKVLLTDKNWFPSCRKNRQHICKYCHMEYIKNSRRGKKIIKVCVECGVKFRALGGHKTCSKKCSEIHREKVKQECYDRMRNNPKRWKEYLERSRRRWKEEPEKYRKWARISYRKNKKRIQANQKAKKLRVQKLIGSQCIFCGNDHHIIYHEIYNKSHPCTPYYILNHIDDFACLCCWCHRAVHWAVKYLGLSWNQIAEMSVGIIK